MQILSLITFIATVVAAATLKHPYSGRSELQRRMDGLIADRDEAYNQTLGLPMRLINEPMLDIQPVATSWAMKAGEVGHMLLYAITENWENVYSYFPSEARWSDPDFFRIGVAYISNLGVAGSKSYTRTIMGWAMSSLLSSLTTMQDIDFWSVSQSYLVIDVTRFSNKIAMLQILRDDDFSETGTENQNSSSSIAASQKLRARDSIINDTVSIGVLSDAPTVKIAINYRFRAIAQPAMVELIHSYLAGEVWTRLAIKPLSESTTAGSGVQIGPMPGRPDSPVMIVHYRKMSVTFGGPDSLPVSYTVTWQRVAHWMLDLLAKYVKDDFPKSFTADISLNKPGRIGPAVAVLQVYVMAQGEIQPFTGPLTVLPFANTTIKANATVAEVT